MKSIVIERKKLSTANKYNFCPTCRKFALEHKLDEASIPALIHIKILNVHNEAGETRETIDEFWECERCKAKLSTWDFVKAYCKKADGSHY